MPPSPLATCFVLPSSSALAGRRNTQLEQGWEYIASKCSVSMWLRRREPRDTCEHRSTVSLLHFSSPIVDRLVLVLQHITSELYPTAHCRVSLAVYNTSTRARAPCSLDPHLRSLAQSLPPSSLYRGRHLVSIYLPYYYVPRSPEVLLAAFSTRPTWSPTWPSFACPAPPRCVRKPRFHPSNALPLFYVVRRANL